MTFAAQILTLYPEMFPGPLGVSLAGRALEEGIWTCAPIHIRDFATDKHRTVDDTPAGGGAGMVLRADILSAAVDFAHAEMAKKILPGTGRGTSEAGGGARAGIDDSHRGDILPTCPSTILRMVPLPVPGRNWPPPSSP